MSAPAYIAAYVPLAAVIDLDAPLTPDTPPLEVVDLALAVPAALTGVCEPLALDLLVGYREPGVPVLEHEPVPERPAWQIVEAGLPDSIVVRPPDVPGAQQVEVPSLSVDAVHAWAEQALDQPMPGLELTLWSLRCNYCRALVSGLPENPDSYVVDTGDRAVAHPVERLDGATWALAPAHDLLMQPPVSWFVSRDVELIAQLWVNWSPWLDPTRPEGAGLKQAVERLQSSGWRLREPVYQLELVP
jgi:hypothetical protein